MRATLKWKGCFRLIDFACQRADGVGLSAVFDARRRLPNRFGFDSSQAALPRELSSSLLRLSHDAADKDRHIHGPNRSFNARSEPGERRAWENITKS